MPCVRIGAVIPAKIGLRWVVIALTLSIVAPLGLLSAASLQRAWRRQRANIDRLDGSLPQARSPALKMLRAELSSEEIASLEVALDGDYDERGVEAALSPKRSLEHLINEPSYNELSLRERAKIMKSIAIGMP